MNKKIKAKFSQGNIKLGNMATFSKLMGDELYDTCYGSVRGSCGGHCEGCKSACYVRKSYRYPSVITGHARNTAAIRIDINQAFEDLNNQLNRKRKPFEIIRINQSGEIESSAEFIKWCELAAQHTESIFYVYSKAYEYITPYINMMPSNMYLLISVWHEQGINVYREFKDHPQIKAFVYLDGFDYPADITPDTTCKAYENGKLNHNITCELCHKCFNTHNKIIGCHEH